jgi:hypothetical protein
LEECAVFDMSGPIIAAALIVLLRAWVHFFESGLAGTA